MNEIYLFFCLKIENFRFLALYNSSYADSGKLSDDMILRIILGLKDTVVRFKKSPEMTSTVSLSIIMGKIKAKFTFTWNHTKTFFDLF